MDFILDLPPIGILVSELKNILHNKASPSYLRDFDLYLNFPKNRVDGLNPMNEELALYLTMFYMSELVRYRPDYLYSTLDSKVGWLLQSFVDFCPLKLLRKIIARITTPVTGSELIIIQQ